MIKRLEFLNESEGHEYPPYMFSPIGFSCRMCKYHYEQDGKHMCSNEHYQEYISEKFPDLDNPAELVNNNGEPIQDPSKWCSNWFMPKKMVIKKGK